MVKKVNGTAFAGQTLTGGLQYYACYALSPLAFSNPQPNPILSEEFDRQVNIQLTGKFGDQSQKNFEILLMSIGLRAMPVVIGDPVAVKDLLEYTPLLSGEGFVWKFAVERANQFYNYGNIGEPGPVGLLVNDIDGVILHSGVRLTTTNNSYTGLARNIVFEQLAGI